MSSKTTKGVMTYDPTSLDRKHMHHCHKLGLIKLSLNRHSDYKDEYNIARLDETVTPFRVHFFLKNFSMPPTPANKAVYTEYEAYKKIFEIYKEFYMRNMNISEEEIKDDVIQTKKEEIIEKEKIIKAKAPKKTKKELTAEKLLNFPNKQIDLLEMIEDCEREKENKSEKSNS